MAKAPGVYVKEVVSPEKVIAGVDTAIVGLIGIAERGDEKVVKVNNWEDYKRKYGDVFIVSGSKSFTPYVAKAYFENGGGRLYMRRVVPTDATSASANLQDGSAVDTLKVEAKNKGAWGNGLSVDVINDNLAETTLTQDVTSGSTVIAVKSLDGFSIGAIIDVDGETKKISGLNYPSKQITLDSALANAHLTDAVVKSLEFDLEVYEDGELVEEWIGLSMGDTSYNAEKVINDDATGSIKITVTDLSSTSADPTPAAVTKTDLTGGADGDYSALVTTDFTGKLDDFNTVDEVLNMLLPEIYKLFTDADIKTAIGVVDEWCQDKMYRYSVHTVSYGSSVSSAVAFVNDIPRNSYGMFYAPWVQVSDLAGSSIWIPPIGHIAGCFARNDNIARGSVGKAPAGLDMALVGVRDVEYELDETDNGDWVGAGLNAIRKFPGSGIVIWGARTLSRDKDLRWVNVRRLFVFVEKSVSIGMRLYLFEGNEPDTRNAAISSIKNFLFNGVWRKGMIQGATPEQAFSVTDVTTQQDIDLGWAWFEVALAVIKPMEKIGIRIGVKKGEIKVKE